MKCSYVCLFFGAAALFSGSFGANAQDIAATAQEVRVYNGPLAPRTYVKPLTGVSASDLEALTSSSGTVPMFHYAIRAAQDGKTYIGSMIGSRPKGPDQGTTIVPVVIVPVIVKLGSYVYSPMIPDGCAGGRSGLNLTLGSPVFTPAPFIINGTYVGTTQYIDALQRSEFWTTDTQSYHTILSPTVYHSQVYAPPIGYIAPGVPCGGTIGLIGILAFDAWATARIADLGIQPSQFVIFLLDNAYLYYLNPSNCCFLGYHSAYGNPLQTYGVAAYDSSGAFGPDATDAVTLSHEVGEWANDPTGVNPTPAWGHVGQVPGCQNNLEVGDPLSGSNLPGITMPNGMTYHIQELAFFSWFYGGPSQGVGGLYSTNGTFTKPSTVCK